MFLLEIVKSFCHIFATLLRTSFHNVSNYVNHALVVYLLYYMELYHSQRICQCSLLITFENSVDPDQFFSVIPSDCQKVWIYIRLDILSEMIGLNCLQTLSADKTPSSRQKVNWSTTRIQKLYL